MLALVTQLVVSIGVALWLGNQYDPYTGFVILATILVDIFAPMYILLNIACITYFWRYRRDEFNWWLHGLIPVLGALAFIPAFCAGAGHPGLQLHHGAAEAAVVRRTGGRDLDGDRRGLPVVLTGDAPGPDHRDQARLRRGLRRVDVLSYRPEPRRVRLDLRRREAGAPGPARHGARAVDRGRLRRQGPRRRRPGVAGHRVPVREPADRPVLHRGRGARRHARRALRLDRAVARLGGVLDHPAVRRAHLDPRHGHACRSRCPSGSGCTTSTAPAAR